MLRRKRDAKVDARLLKLTEMPAIKFEEIRPLKRWVQRTSERRSVYKFGMLATRNKQQIKCIVRDLSIGGARLALNGAEILPETFILVIDGYSAPTNARRVWQIENEAGIAFI